MAYSPRHGLTDRTGCVLGREVAIHRSENPAWARRATKKLRIAICSVKPDVMANRLRAVLTCDAQAELRRVPVPILYVAATKDLLVRAASLRIVQRIRPDTEVARISGPHLIAQRKPSDTATAVVEFLRRIT